MNRTILAIADLSSASGLLLLDSAIKGAALLILAAFATLILRRDSAATRHLVWLLAIVAMLLVPVLSAMLPRWRVLPEWTAIPHQTAVVAPKIAATPRRVFESRQPADPAPVEISSTTPHQPATEPPDAHRASAKPPIIPETPVLTRKWLTALPLIWATGFSLLILRLVAARLMLWNSESRATRATSDPILRALETARLQLGVRPPITLLIHANDDTVPLVWGILRYRLLLPSAARDWTTDQLQSVLLHELAHIKRRDTIAQLLAQIVCALHWFNPLAWFAAWRLAVERERACDDLVLASGVRPSTYAGHLLDIVTRLSPAARWTHSCGLAIARKSSLEGRLVAVINQNLNRRRVSLALSAIALAIAAAIAVPVAMLRAADKPAQKQEPQASQKPQNPSESPKMKPETEQKLKWGEPVNGLRMALAWPPSLGEPGMGDAEEFYLVVQNVSDAPVRLIAGDAAPNPRSLVTRGEGKPLQSLSDGVPMPGDWALQPRGTAFIRLFQRTEKTKDGRTMSSLMEEDIRSFPQYSFTAEMTIDKAPAGAWTGKLATAASRGSLDVIAPNHKASQSLLKSWTTAARLNGKIPGALIGQLADSVKTFTTNNPTWKTTPQLLKMLPRFDASHDSSAQDAVALLDELAALQDTPIEMAVDHESQQTIRTGKPLPPALANAPWGQPLTNGLRLAWLLEPRAAEYPLNTALTSRVLIHNAGKEPVVFRTRTWHQVEHKATDANGAEFKVDSTHWLTRGLLVPFRLEPGEFVELSAPGFGIGNTTNAESWHSARVGSWINAKPGDDVTVTTSPVPLSDWNEKPELDGEPRWWLDFITARLSRHLPFPPGAEARKLLLYRVAMELFGTPVNDELFPTDQQPTALDSLAKRLFHRPGLHAWAGPLTSAPTKFRVLPADPNIGTQTPKPPVASPK